MWSTASHGLTSSAPGAAHGRRALMAGINPLSLDRRRLLESASLAAGAAVMPRVLSIPSAMAQAASTMVVAAPATPQSLDCNFDVSLGTFEAIGGLYDGLLGFNK